MHCFFQTFRNLTVGTVDAFAGVVLSCEIAGKRGEAEMGTSTLPWENIGRDGGERREWMEYKDFLAIWYRLYL